MTQTAGTGQLAGVLPIEADRIRELLLRHGGEISPLLNVGSSTAAFRTMRRPHIETRLFAPLHEAGVAVDHLDLKAGAGVDIVGDILDPALRGTLRERGYRCVLLCNVLEHVRERGAVAAACVEIVGQGGTVLATVPRSYPYHADPLDTGYRPSPDVLGALFPGCEVRASETVTGPTYAEALREAGRSPLGEALRTVRAAVLAPIRPRSAWSRLQRWLWYRRPYRVALVLLEVR